MCKFVRLAALSVVAVIGGWTGSASATDYTFSVLSSSYGGETHAFGLNNLGDVVGSAYQGLNEGAALWHNGVYTSLRGVSSDPDIDYGEAHAINDAGQIAGLSTMNGAERATLWIQGEPIDLQAQLASGLNSGMLSSNAWAINDSGEIVGNGITNRRSGFAFRASAGANGGVIDVIWGTNGLTARAINNSGLIAGIGGTPTSAAPHALLWANGVLQELPNLGGRASYAAGINDRGEVVGASELLGNLQRHAAYWSGSSVVDLGTLGESGDFGFALDINNRGEIVGLANVKAGGATHAAMWVDGVAIDLNTLLDPALLADGWVLNDATAINDEGWIVGNAQHGTVTQGYLLRPVSVPEAPAGMMMLLGCLAMAGVSRCRHLREL